MKGNLHITELVKRAAQGDTQAFGLLYDEFADRIYKFIYIKVNDKAVAEDLLQEVFLKVWQGCPKLKIEDLKFSAWLYTVASNTINDHYRKVYRRPQTVELDPTFEQPSTDDATRLTEQHLSADELSAALDNLDTNHRHVLELRFIQEFSIEETAQVLGKTNLATRLLQHRAIKKLKTIYEK